MFDSPSDYLVDVTTVFYRSGGGGSERAVSQPPRGCPGSGGRELGSQSVLIPHSAWSSCEVFSVGLRDGSVYQPLSEP